MSVGSVSHSSLWGCSRLWHDPNYQVALEYRVPGVQRGINTDQPLPKEEHIPPPQKAEDPFNVQFQAYDMAAEQMNRGIEGQKRLNGTRNAQLFDAAVSAVQQQSLSADVTRATVVAPQPLPTQQPTGNVRPVEPQPAVPGQVSTPSDVTQGMTSKEAEHAVKDARDVSNMVDAVAVGVGGVVSASTVFAKTAGGAVGAAQSAAAVSVTAPATVVATGGANIASHEPEAQDLPPDDPCAGR